MIQIWKFSLAPVEYRELYRNQPQPGWIALIPVGIHSTDLDEEIRKRAIVETKVCLNGDMLYAGEFQMEQLVAALASVQSNRLGD